MGLFSAFTKVIIDTATLPIAVVKDALTLGGIVTEQSKSYTEQKLDQIKSDAEDADK